MIKVNFFKMVYIVDSTAKDKEAGTDDEKTDDEKTAEYFTFEKKHHLPWNHC